jgi:hypothetical protein
LRKRKRAISSGYRWGPDPLTFVRRLMKVRGSKTIRYRRGRRRYYKMCGKPVEPRCYPPKDSRPSKSLVLITPFHRPLRSGAIPFRDYSQPFAPELRPGRRRGYDGFAGSADMGLQTLHSPGVFSPSATAVSAAPVDTTHILNPRKHQSRGTPHFPLLSLHVCGTSHFSLHVWVRWGDRHNFPS